MAPQTDRVFAALANPHRIDLLRMVLLLGEATGPELRKRLGFSQPTLSKHLRPLIDEGLLARTGSMHAPLRAPQPREARALLRAAALIQAAHYGSIARDAAELAQEMLRDDMARGAAEEDDVA